MPLLTSILNQYLCRKLEDFRRSDEKRAHPEILQTRYDFHHNKRFYKLGEIYKKREEQRALEAEKAQQRYE